MSLGQGHHHVQVVLETIDHLWKHQVTGLVVLEEKKNERGGQLPSLTQIHIYGNKSLYVKKEQTMKNIPLLYRDVET